MSVQLTPAARGRLRRRRVANAVFVGLTMFAAFVALAALALITTSLFINGMGGLNLDVFTKSTPAHGSEGGLLNAIVGSLMMCALAMVIAIVIGVLAGTYLAEYDSTSVFAHAVRFVNDVLLSAPSILVGLFVYEILVRPFSYSGYAGAAALGLIALPIVTRTTEDILHLQPQNLREAGMALGAPRWVTIRRIVWRAAAPGMLTGALLAFARISGETAPLLFTALGHQFFSADLGKPIASLPIVIFNFGLSPYDDLIKLAWTGALLIAIVVLAVNILGRVLAQRNEQK